MPNVASARSRVSETRQPQARLDHDRQAHTGKQLAAFDTNLIGLHVLQIQLGHFDDVLMHPLTMQSGPILPARYSAFIETKGMDNAEEDSREQRHHDDDMLSRLAQPF